MSNSNFDKNGLDNSGIHWLQYAAFVVTAFSIYFGFNLKSHRDKFDKNTLLVESLRYH